MYFNIAMIMRSYNAYESVWLALGKNCHAKGERAISENLFAITLTIAELILSYKIPQFAQYFYEKWVNFSLNYWKCSSTTMC